MSYCKVEDVLEIIPNRDINNQNSIISPDDVDNLILHADNIINLYLKSEGVENEISNYTDELKTIEALMVAGMIEARLKADDGGEEGDLPNNALYKEGVTLLEKLTKNNIIQPIDDPENEINAILDSDNELEALFFKNKRQW